MRDDPSKLAPSKFGVVPLYNVNIQLLMKHFGLPPHHAVQDGRSALVQEGVAPEPAPATTPVPTKPPSSFRLRSASKSTFHEPPAQEMSAMLALLEKLDQRLVSLEASKPAPKPAESIQGAVGALEALSVSHSTLANPKGSSLLAQLSAARGAREGLPPPPPPPVVGRARGWRQDRSDSDNSDAEDPPKRRSAGQRVDGRIAKELILAMHERGHRRAMDDYRAADMKNARNGHELRRVSQAIDAAMDEGITSDHLVLELLLRTAAGLRLADDFGDQGLLEEIEWSPPEAVVPRDMLRTLMKDSARRKALKPKAGPSPSPSPSRGRGRGAGRV
jgi:hypothetical protein